MARRMHALIVAHREVAASDTVQLLARTDGPSRLLPFALNAVFGAPFVGSALLLARSQLWPGRGRLLDAVGLTVGSAWADVAALGFLWAGVNLMLLVPGGRRPGALCLVGGALLLFGREILTTS